MAHAQIGGREESYSIQEPANRTAFYFTPAGNGTWPGRLR